MLCIGSELLSGKLNTHIGWFSLRLREAGLPVTRTSTLPDTLSEVTLALSAALSRSDIVIASGGLGPTFDDLTREAAAQALGRRLRFKPRLFAEIKAKFRRAKVHMPEENRRQAYVLEGASPLPNPNGSAPGQLVEVPRQVGRQPKVLAMLPGPYNEMAPMFEAHVLPVLRRRYGGERARETLSLHFCGLTESAADEMLQPVLLRMPENVKFTILGGPGLVHLHATADAPTREKVHRLLGRVRRSMPPALMRHCFGVGEDTLESVAGRLLRRAGGRLAVAESCTGGLLSSRITDIPGSSDYFVGGLIAYSNALKTSGLGVSPATLKHHGAVSEACAREMAAGARERFGADYALAITGIAGPGGGSAQKPVGLVFVGLALPKGRPLVVKQLLYGDRHAIRERSVNAALNILRRVLEKGGK